MDSMNGYINININIYIYTYCKYVIYIYTLYYTYIRDAQFCVRKSRGRQRDAQTEVPKKHVPLVPSEIPMALDPLFTAAAGVILD